MFAWASWFCVKMAAAARGAQAYNRAAIGLACAQAKGRSRLTRAHHQRIIGACCIYQLSSSTAASWMSCSAVA